MVDYKKQGKANRRKGTEYERKVARKMTELTGMTWRRTPYSGAGHIPGDVMRLPEPFEYEIELKNRNDVSLLRAFKNPNSLQPYVSDKQILMFNDNGLTLVVMHEDIAIDILLDTNYNAVGTVTSLDIGNDAYSMVTLKDFCAMIKENYEGGAEGDNDGNGTDTNSSECNAEQVSGGHDATTGFIDGRDFD